MAISKAKGRFARLIQITWGLPQNVVGGLLYLLYRRTRRQGSYRSAFVTEWGSDAGLSLGMFVFVPKGAHQSLVVHEYGHTLQSLLLGPIYLPMIVLPSLLWAGLPACTRFRERRDYSYYRFFCERWANRLAMCVTHERPIGWY